MTEKEYQVYKNIDFYKRYNENKVFFHRSNHEEDFGTLEKNIIINFFNEQGYKARYIGNGRFFKIHEKNKPYVFNFHVAHLLWGAAEIMMFAKNTNSSIFIGNTFGNICSDIDNFLNGSHERRPLPTFRNIEDLYNALKEALVIYQDFKKEFVKHY
jgi:hypothetical protein